MHQEEKYEHARVDMQLAHSASQAQANFIGLLSKSRRMQTVMGRRRAITPYPLS
jgi:hypothetical protein